MSAPTRCGETPARNLPFGLVFDVSNTLRSHGLDAPIVAVVQAIAQIINKTPLEQGGRLRPDGTVDRADAEPAATSVDHGITVEQVQMPAGRPFRASCLCGWTSPIVGARPAAVAAGGEHTRQVTQLVGLGE